MNPAMISEALATLTRSLVLSSRLPRTRRVRRRGFRATVKSGSLVTVGGREWVVARRSNWSLWLYEHEAVDASGTKIAVHLPRRYDTQF